MGHGRIGDGVRNGRTYHTERIDCIDWRTNLNERELVHPTSAKRAETTPLSCHERRKNRSKQYRDGSTTPSVEIERVASQQYNDTLRVFYQIIRRVTFSISSSRSWCATRENYSSSCGNARKSITFSEFFFKPAVPFVTSIDKAAALILEILLLCTSTFFNTLTFHRTAAPSPRHLHCYGVKVVSLPLESFSATERIRWKWFRRKSRKIDNEMSDGYKYNRAPPRQNTTVTSSPPVPGDQMLERRRLFFRFAYI